MGAADCAMPCFAVQAIPWHAACEPIATTHPKRTQCPLKATQGLPSNMTIGSHR